MARIYYKDKALKGHPLISTVITPLAFSDILKKVGSSRFEFSPANTSVFSLFKRPPALFRYVLTNEDGINYDHSDFGHFYLPNSIIFYDIDKHNFPNTFYFIAEIDGSIELLKATGGKKMEWFRMPERYRAVQDRKIKERIEASFVKLVNQVTADGALLSAEERTIRPLLPVAIRDAYKELATICLARNSCKAELLNFLDNMNDYEGDEYYHTSLNFLLDHLEINRIPFIGRLDVKTEIYELESYIAVALKENFGKEIPLPTSEKFGDFSVSLLGVFDEFSDALNQHGFQLGFINTYSDEYIILVHTLTDEEPVAACVQGIGYPYHNTTDDQ